MNEPIDEQFERLISRKLDGELTEAESLELDRRLIRDPARQRYLEQSVELDALAAAAIQEACAAHCEPLVVESVAPARGRGRVWIGAGPLAAAACLALWMAWPVFSPQSIDSPDQTQMELAEGGGDFSTPVPGNFLRHDNAPMFADWDGQAQARSPLRSVSTNTDYYGVYDEKAQKLYWLEVQSTKTQQRRPRQQTQSRAVLTSGDM